LNCGAPDCSVRNHSVAKFEEFTVASPEPNCWPAFGYEHFVQTRPGPEHKPLPKPKVKPATVKAVRKIWNMDAKADVYDRYLLECRATNTPPMPYGREWIKLLAWKWREKRA
jgi:hypothetical protein